MSYMYNCIFPDFQTVSLYSRVPIAESPLFSVICICMNKFYISGNAAAAGNGICLSDRIIPV